MTPPVEQCQGCLCPMMRCVQPPQGIRRHEAHGHCKPCYRRLTEHWEPEPVDEIAVERAALGDPVRLRPIERRAVVVLLTRRGLSGRQIAERLAITERTVFRARSRARVAA